MPDMYGGSGPTDLFLSIDDDRIPVHSRVLGQYCRLIAAVMAQPQYLDRDPQTGLPLIVWTWPAGVRIPPLLSPYRSTVTVPVMDAAKAVLTLCYQQYFNRSPLRAAVEMRTDADPYVVAVLAVLAAELGWHELRDVLDRILSELRATLLGPEMARFAKQIGLRATLQAAIRIGVRLDPFQLESVAGVTLADVSDAIKSWPDPPLRFIDLVRCVAQLDLTPDEIMRKARREPYFYIVIDGTERFRYLLHWTRSLNIWGQDFWQGWFSRYGYAIVNQIKVRPSAPNESYDIPKLHSDLLKIILEVIKNEIVCMPNPDPKFARLNMEQIVNLRPKQAWSMFV